MAKTKIDHEKRKRERFDAWRKETAENALKEMRGELIEEEEEVELTFLKPLNKPSKKRKRQRKSNKISSREIVTRSENRAGTVMKKLKELKEFTAKFAHHFPCIDEWHYKINEAIELIEEVDVGIGLTHGEIDQEIEDTRKTKKQ